MHLFSLLGGKRKRKERESNGRRCHLIYPQDLRVPIINWFDEFSTPGGAVCFVLLRQPDHTRIV